MSFSTAQLKKLTGKLDRQHVHTRKLAGKDIDYIEGWFAIAEANAIFGFGGWDREMTHFERVFERTRGEVTTCSYMARVRIEVRAGAAQIVREGSGIGSASCSCASDAHERAIKAAETDATNRALATFGNRFGLGLYDKEQAGVTARPPIMSFTLKDTAGHEVATNVSAEAFCSGLRQMVNMLSSRDEIEKCHCCNADEITRLRDLAPQLRTNKGEHFADILERLFAVRLVALESPVTQDAKQSHNGADRCDASQEADPPEPGGGSGLRPVSRSHIDKAVLPIGVVRRIRDKDHLRHVGSLPCLICEQTPSHAHHLTFAQRRVWLLRSAMNL